MLDLLLGWAVVILPTLLAVGIEAAGKRTKKRRAWRFSVIAFGLAISGLTWWQQSRAARDAARQRDSAIRNTAEQVATETSARVTSALNREYGSVISGLYKRIGRLETEQEGELRLRKRQLQLSYAPSVDLIYAGDQLQIWNRGKTNISLWGDKYGGERADMGTVPYIISPASSRYLLTDELKKYIVLHLGQNGQARVPVDLYISTANGTRYVLHGELWEIVKDGQITIHTQNHGFEKKDWSQRP